MGVLFSELPKQVHTWMWFVHTSCKLICILTFPDLSVFFLKKRFLKKGNDFSLCAYIISTFLLFCSDDYTLLPSSIKNVIQSEGSYGTIKFHLFFGLLDTCGGRTGAADRFHQRAMPEENCQCPFRGSVSWVPTRGRR